MPLLVLVCKLSLEDPRQGGPTPSINDDSPDSDR